MVGKSGVMAFVWLTEETYPRFLEVIADRQRFTDRFEGWRQIAQRQVDGLRAQGINVVKVPVDPDEMLAWCRSKGRAVDRDGRAAFAVFKFSQDDHHGT